MAITPGRAASLAAALSLAGCLPVVAGILGATSGGGGGGGGGGAAPQPGPSTPAPTAQPSPGSGPSAGGQTLLVGLVGAGELVSPPVVTVGGLAASGVTVVSPTAIAFVTPPYALGNRSGQVPLEVRGGAWVATGSYSYQAAAPTIRSIAPLTGPSNGGTSVTLLGSGFVQGCRVSVNGVEASGVSASGDAALSFFTPAGARGSDATVVLTHPDGFVVTAATPFRYGAPSAAAPAPTVAPSVPRYPGQAGISTYSQPTTNSLQMVRALDVDGDGEVEILSVIQTVVSGHNTFIFRVGSDGVLAERTYHGQTLGGRQVIKFCDLITGGRPEATTQWGTPSFGFRAYPFVSMTAISMPTGNTTVSAVAMGDLDGALGNDIVYSSVGAAGVVLSTVRGDGLGSFGARTDLAVAGTSLSSLDLAQLDGDGRLDVVGLSPAGSLLVYLGNGDGSLAAPSTVACGASPSELKLADVTGDGRCDAIVRRDGAVSILAGDGAGSFAAPTDLTGLTGTGEVCICDLDLDGRLDLAVAVSGAPVGLVAVLRGTGGGSFAPRVDSVVNSVPVSVDARDLDRDGKVDLVVGSKASDTVVLLRGRGDGSLRCRTAPWTSAGGAAARDMALADLTGDGRPDVVLATGAQLLVLRNDGAGALLSPVATATGSVSAAGVAVGQLDGDALLDVVATNETDRTVSVVRGDGAGGALARADVTLSGSPARPVLADVNQDGRLDVIAPITTTSGTTSQVAVLLGDGAGGLGAPVYVTTGVNPRVVQLGDIDGDGKLDLVVGCKGNGSPAPRVSLHRGLTGGTFGAATDTVIAGGVEDLLLADVTGDGRLDALVCSGTTGTGFLVLAGTAVGSFAAPVSAGGSMLGQRMVLADLNADGATDLVLTQSGGTAALCLGRPGPAGLAFGDVAAALQEVGGGPMNVVRAVDLDGDGKLELVACSQGAVTLLRQE